MKKVEKSNEFLTWEKPMVKSVRKYKLEQKSARTVYCINMPLPVQRLVEVSSAVHEIESIVEFYICDEDCSFESKKSFLNEPLWDYQDTFATLSDKLKYQEDR